MKPIAVVFGDAHLQRGAWAHRPIRDDSFYSLTQILETAVEKEVEAVLGLGDLIDVHLPKSETLVPASWLVRTKLKPAGIPLYYIQGQHEKSETPWLSICENAHWVDQKEVSLKGRNFWGLDYRSGPEFEKAVKGIPAHCDVLLAHQPWAEVMGMERSEARCELLPEHVTTVLSGDFHKHMKIEGSNSAGDPVSLVFTGSTCMQSIDEEHEKRFYLLYEDLSLQSIKLKTRPVLETEILFDKDDLDEFLHVAGDELEKMQKEALELGIPEQITKPICYVHYDASLSDFHEKVKRMLGNRAHLFTKCHRVAEKERKLPDKVTSMSAKEVLKEVIEDHRSPLYELCSELLGTNDVENVLAKTKERMTGV